MDLDSLRPLHCQIESAAEVSGHIEYVVRLFVPHIESQAWRISKRYNDFATLHASLEAFGLFAELPPKRAFGNKEREFVAERQSGLQTYLSSVISNPFLLSSKAVKQFLHPGSRMTDIAGSALQFLAMVFRTDSRFEIAAPLPQIGWRVNKEFATVKCMTEPKTKYTGCWIFYGPDRILLPVEISALLTSFCQIKHPLFFPLFFADARDTGCVTVRPTQSQGSLWDMLKGNKMAQQFLQKSARNKFGKPLSEEDIQRIGRQILEALKFFHDNSIPYGNLSSRNVFLDNDGAHVTDTESGVCGLRSFYWPFILQLRKIQTFEAIDVYCFGHLLYEMAFGRACETPTCDNLAATNCPPLIRAVLESILTPEAARGGMPAVSQLLTQPLFSNVVLNYDPVSMKMSRKLKDALVSAKAQMEERFVAEQKLYQAYLKNQKAYTLQSSEEERKKRRLQALKSQSSTSDNNGGDNNCGFTTRTPTPTGHNGEAAGMPPPKTPTSPPPPPPPMPSSAGPPPPPPPMKIVNNGNVSTSGTSDGSERNALLASIRGFKKDALAAAETADKSGPYIE